MKGEEGTGAGTGGPGSTGAESQPPDDREHPVPQPPPPPLPDAGQELRRLLAFFFLFFVLFGFVFHVALQVIAELACKSPRPATVPPWVTLMLWFATLCLGCLSYTLFLRRGLLLRHRLSAVCDGVHTGAGFLEIAVPAVVVFVPAAVLEALPCRKNWSLGPGSEAATALLVPLAAAIMATWLVHLIDYTAVVRLLSLRYPWDISMTLDRAGDDFQARLAGRRRPEGVGEIDDLPDREIDPRVHRAVLLRLRNRLVHINADFAELRDRYGNIVAIFHPDYLAHLAHIYLKVSQMRALNMAARRIQLLGRRWTLHGLESEYVLVHDISDLRSEYVEWPWVKRNFQTVAEILDDHCKPSSASGFKRFGSILPPSDQGPAAGVSRAATELLRELIQTVREPKWRQRSLKKRATVVVAPDGSLLRIAIEEERQFNI
jgi:hypothetical protein